MLKRALEDDPRPKPAPLLRALLRAQRLSSAIGAVVDAGDLAAAGPDGLSQLRQLVVDHHVVFVRGFGRDEGRFRELAASFGTLTVHPLQRFTGREQPISVIEDTPAHPPADFPWHTDLSWIDVPPRFGILQALEIPPSGGDTLWASLPAAYSALSPAIQALCSTLTGWHGVDASLRRTVVSRHGAELASRFEEAHPPVRHPLVRAHPDTGAPCLFVCPMYLERIPELHPDESAVLLSHLHDVAVDPNRSLRWHWSEGDVAIWDEACTLHRALRDHHPAVRRMRRCTTDGGRPLDLRSSGVEDPKAVGLRRISIDDLDRRPRPLPNADAWRAGELDQPAGAFDRNVPPGFGRARPVHAVSAQHISEDGDRVDPGVQRTVDDGDAVASTWTDRARAHPACRAIDFPECESYPDDPERASHPRSEG